ncbi:MAG: hypothetical protein CMP84_08635 [Gammaproteobacteria bacterium]|nr:hypothetical protein [Gammaproteobacteria bacterium]MBU14186.1 hypothetical protein [Gammaproteobacteria bacterium]
MKAGAESDEGLFTVHRLDDKMYFEIPAAVLRVRLRIWLTVPRYFCLRGG